MATATRIATSGMPQRIRSGDFVAWPVVIVSCALGASATFLVVRDLHSSGLALILGVAAVLVAVLGVPLALARGTGVVVALCAALILSPTSATVTVIRLGLELSSLALAVALVRTWVSGRAAAHGLRATALVGAGAYVALLELVSILGVKGYAPDVVALSVVAPGILSVLVARAFTEGDLRVFARGLIGFAVLQVIVAAIDLLVRPLPFLGYNSFDGVTRLQNQLLAGPLPRAQAMVAHPIVLALVIIVAMGLTWTDTARLPRTVRAALLVILAAGLVLSGTRSAILALAVAAIYVSLSLAKSVGRRIRNGLVIAISALMLAIIPASARYFTAAVTNLGGSASYTHRAGAWNSLPDALAGRGMFELLFGTGAGSEWSLFAAGFLQQDGLAVIDNQVVTTIICAGFVGLLVLLVLVVRTIVSGSTAIRVMLIMLIVMANSFDLLRWPGPAILVFVCFGLVDNPAFRRSPGLSEQPVPTERLRLRPQPVSLTR